MTHLEDALTYANLTKISTDEWLARVRAGKYTPTQLKATAHYKAHTSLITAAKPPPPVPVPPPNPTPASLFSGRGVFTTSNAQSASGLHSAWIAVQKDPEGDPAPVVNNNPGRIVWWQARPTQAVADEANRRSIPYIGQAESQAELDKCLALNLTVQKALIGNAGSWTDAGAREAARQGWDLIQEWYWNAHPWELSPDAHGYPRFVNVCYGTYDASSEHPGVGRRVTVPEYRAVWHGPFSCWPADTMVEADRAGYNAP